MGVSNSLFSLCFAMSSFFSGQLRWGGSVYIAFVLSVNRVGYNLKLTKKVDSIFRKFQVGRIYEIMSNKSHFRSYMDQSSEIGT